VRTVAVLVTVIPERSMHESAHSGRGRGCEVPRRKDLPLPSRIWPVTQLLSLDAETCVKFAVGKAWHLGLAAEVEIPVLWVANRPSAVVAQERGDRLSLPRRDYQVVVSEGCGLALIYSHELS